MALENKAKKGEKPWTNPFNGRYHRDADNYMDENGYGMFTLVNMGSKPKQQPVTQTAVSEKSSVEQDQEILKQILADKPPPLNMDPLFTDGPEVTKPTKPISPYMRFSRNLWEEYRKNHTVVKFSEVGKMIGESWRNLDEAERNKYQQDYEQDKVTYFKQLEQFKKQEKESETNQVSNSTEPDPKDPLVSLIKQINQLKQKSQDMVGQMTADNIDISALNDFEKLITNSELLEAHKNAASNKTPTNAPCPNVNPFPLASIFQPKTPTSLTATLDTTESQKQILQQRIMERIKSPSQNAGPAPTGPAGVPTGPAGAITTLTNSSFSPIPAVRLEPSPKTSNLQLHPPDTVDNENVRLLKLLIPNFSQSGGSTPTAPPNYTAVPLSRHSPQPPAGNLSPFPKQQPANKQSTVAPVVMNNDQCCEMFQNIKKQISEQAVFALTATIHQTSHDNEGLILVVTRNKIDIHPQFGPIHVARVVITNKLFYKFFVLDKVVDSGQVGGKEISEVFWKLSEVSKHLLCPGFNQRYISKVEQTLGEKVEDVTSSYCRLTAKMCTVWHQKDSKPGQKRNYHTRDLCGECLDLYHRLQWKTYSLKLKHGGSRDAQSNKREQQSVFEQSSSKKPKLNGSFTPNSLASTLLPNNMASNAMTTIGDNMATLGNNMATLGNRSLVSGGAMNDQQLKVVLSNLVASNSVIQVNKDSDGDDLVDILGEDSPLDTQPITNQPTANHLTANQPTINPTHLSQLPNLTEPSDLHRSSNLTPLSVNITNSSINAPLLTSTSPAPAAAPAASAGPESPHPNLVISSSYQTAVGNIAPNVVVLPNNLATSQPTFVLANGGMFQKHESSNFTTTNSVGPKGDETSANQTSKIDELLKSLTELQNTAPQIQQQLTKASKIKHMDDHLKNLLSQLVVQNTATAATSSNTTNNTITPDITSLTSNLTSQPATTPLLQPATAPLSQPATVPLLTTATAPLSQPATAPLSQPATAPLLPPATAPLLTPATAPLLPPATTPLLPPTLSTAALNSEMTIPATCEKTEESVICDLVTESTTMTSDTAMINSTEPVSPDESGDESGDVQTNDSLVIEED